MVPKEVSKPEDELIILFFLGEGDGMEKYSNLQVRHYSQPNCQTYKNQVNFCLVTKFGVLIYHDSVVELLRLGIIQKSLQ